MRSLEKRLGSQVAYHRKLARVTQAELAEKVNVAPETISRLERGAVMPSLTRLEQVAAALGRDLHDFFQSKQPVGRNGHALDRLVACVQMLSAEDIDLVTDLAARIFRHMNWVLDKRHRRSR
jgi:transcriptional regulator with XRE-family HTH domain